MKHLTLSLLTLLSGLSLPLAAQTVGQWELRKKTTTGMQSYGITAVNGQAIGFTAGVPAMIPFAPLANPTFTGTINGAALSLTGNISVTGSISTGSGNFETTVGNISTGGGTISGNGSGITTLNASNIASGTLNAARLATSGVTAGSYTSTNLTVDTYGRITAASNGSASTTVDSEVQSYRDRVIAAGGYVDAATLAAMDAFVVRGRRSGWWTSLVSVYPCAGSNLAASLQKLKYHASEGAALVAGAGFAESHYSQQTGWLVITSGSTVNLATGLVPTTAGMQKSDMFFGVSHISPGSITANWFLCDDQTSGAPGIRMYYQGTILGGNATTTHQNVAPKVWSMNVKSGTYTAHHSGMTMWDFTSNSAGTEVNTQIYLFRDRGYGSTSAASAGVGMCVFGTGLTEAQARDCNAAILAFEKASGRTLYQPESINFVGDSITSGQVAGTTVSDFATKGFAARVARNLGRRQANMGMPSAQLRATGATAAGHYPYRAAIAALEAGLIVLAGGTNDVGQDTAKLAAGTAGVDDAANTGIGYNNYHAKLQATLQACLDQNRSIVCVGPFYRKPASASEACQRNYAAAAATAAAQTSPPVPFFDADRLVRDLTDPNTAMTDDVHPNATGHDLIATALSALIRNGETWRMPSLDFPSIDAGGSQSLTVEMLNIATTQAVTVEPMAAVASGVTFSAYISAANTVTVTAYNSTAGILDPAASRVRLIVR